MMLKAYTTALSFLSLTLCLNQEASAELLAVPFEPKNAPPVDLLYNGEPVDRDRAAELRAQGVDLSELDPQENDVWKNKKLPLTNEHFHNFPPEDATLTHTSTISGQSGVFRALLSHKGTNFRLVMSLDSHAALARAALLRHMGYPIDNPKYYPTLKVQFETPAKLEGFLNDLSRKTLTTRKRWIVEIDEEAAWVVLQDLVLEPAAINTPPYHWGGMRADRILGRRALRGLITPLALLDIGEKVNVFAWEMGRIVDNHVTFLHPYASAWGEATYEDLRWAVKRLADLDRGAWAQVIDLAHYPKGVDRVIMEKAIARRNDLVKVFQVQAPILDIVTQYSHWDPVTKEQIVKEGKVIKAEFPGYAVRFSYGDPESPLRAGEIFRYFSVEGISYALARAATELNKLLTIKSAEDIIDAQGEKIQEKFIKHVMENPLEPFKEPVATFAGPIAGFNVSARRNVVTGTYYGTDARASLVDTISVSGNVGLFMGMTGLPKTIPSLTANLFASRNYVHVRPVMDVKSALKRNWLHLFLPGYMVNLASTLQETEGKDEEGNTIDLDETARLKNFLDELKEGEMFIVSDMIGLGAQANLTIPITALMGADPLGYVNNVVLGGGSTALMVRRTTFYRTEEGIQVYLQHIGSGAMNVSMDFNYWLNILRMAHRWGIGKAKTKAFIIDSLNTDNPSDDEKVLNRRVTEALIALLKCNNSEILENEFSHYSLDHHLTHQTTGITFLNLQWTSLTERHRVKIKPEAKDGVNPDDHERTLYRIRKLNRSGMNHFNLLSKIVEALTPGNGFDQGQYGVNPAYSFLGQGKWWSASTEAEVTPSRVGEYISTVEYHWAGWLLSKQGLFEILDLMEERLGNFPIRMPPIRRDAFAQTKSLQMYEISSTLLVFKAGVERLREHYLRGRTYDELLDGLTVENADPRIVQFCKIPSKRYDHPPSWHDPSKPRRRLNCTKDWMVDLAKLTRWSPSNPVEEVEYANALVGALEPHVPLEELMTVMGEENFYYQIRVSGFRVGAEEDSDKHEYLSDTVGTSNRDVGVGVFREFARKYGITEHELYARYLSGEGV